ncbi:hypothetical protein GH733_000889 [Mirounga leonina]|nr:hypothetical protein GH733_000889 [Mirounga leonina]
MQPRGQLEQGFGRGKSFVSVTRPYFGIDGRNPWAAQRIPHAQAKAPRSQPASPPVPRATALDRFGLQKAGFTHVLNAAHGRWNVDTGPDYYRDMAIEYHGVEADDLPTFDLSVFFYPAAAFIDAALSRDHSKRPATLEVTKNRESRSATLVLAYLMIHKNMTVVDAIRQVAKNRCVLPNRGFLKQLRELDKQLVEQRRQAQRSDNSEKAGEKEP